MGKSNTCGQIFVQKLNKKITVHRKTGETCAEARERVRKKWAGEGETPQAPAGVTGGGTQKMEGQL